MVGIIVSGNRLGLWLVRDTSVVMSDPAPELETELIPRGFGPDLVTILLFLP